MASIYSKLLHATLIVKYAVIFGHTFTVPRTFYSRGNVEGNDSVRDDVIKARKIVIDFLKANWK